MPREIETKADALAYFDALERGQDVARVAAFREASEWIDQASPEELLAFAVPDLCSDPEALASATEAREQIEWRRNARRNRYVATRFIRHGRHSTAAPARALPTVGRRPRPRRPRSIVRTSSRSGDSGDSSPGDLDLPLLARLWRAFWRAWSRR